MCKIQIDLDFIWQADLRSLYLIAAQKKKKTEYKFKNQEICHYA